MFQQIVTDTSGVCLQKCGLAGRRNIVVPKTSESSDNTWIGLTKYLVSGWVYLPCQPVECCPPACYCFTLDTVSIIFIFCSCMKNRTEGKFLHVSMVEQNRMFFYHFDHCLWTTCVVENALFFVVVTVQMLWKLGAWCATVVHVFKRSHQLKHVHIIL